MSKEALAILVDVGKGMNAMLDKKPYLQWAKEAVIQAIQNKMVYCKKDEVGIVLFGTKEASNSLYDQDPEQYKHVTIPEWWLTPQRTNFKLLKEIVELKYEGAEGDLFDAIVVATDMLVQHTGKRKYTKRILLITDCGSPCSSWPDEMLEQVVDNFKTKEIALHVVGLDFDEYDDDGHIISRCKRPTATKSEGQERLRKFVEKLGDQGTIIGVVRAFASLTELRTRSINITSKFRGNLELHGELKIPVRAFTKTTEMKFPSLNKVSLKSKQATDMEFKTMRVETQSIYEVIDESAPTGMREIPKEERIQAYFYGKQMVPFNDMDKMNTKVEGDKHLKLIGFIPMKDLPRNYLMAGTDVFGPEPGDDRAGVAFASLVIALEELGQCAVVRYVYQKNRNPRLGVMIPHRKKHGGDPVLYYSHLPFFEDIREYEFDKLGRKAKDVPNDAQKACVDRLMESMDLMTALTDEEGGIAREALRPKDVFNPALQRFYQTLMRRALHPDAPIAEIDSVVLRYIEPDSELLERARDPLTEFTTLFPLKITAEREKTLNKKRQLNELLELRVAREQDLAAKRQKFDQALNGHDDLGLDSMMHRTSRVRSVGSTDPINDFRTMIDNRAEDLVEEAIKGMSSVVMEMLDHSFKGSYFDKAYECLKAMREASIQQVESALFNESMREIKAKCERKSNLKEFWQSLKKRNLTLISSDESNDDNDPSPEECAKFLHGDQEVVPEPVPEEPVAEEDVGDVGDMI